MTLRQINIHTINNAHIFYGKRHFSEETAVSMWPSALCFKTFLTDISLYFWTNITSIWSHVKKVTALIFRLRGYQYVLWIVQCINWQHTVAIKATRTNDHDFWQQNSSWPAANWCHAANCSLLAGAGSAQKQPWWSNWINASKHSSWPMMSGVWTQAIHDL